jgi:PHD/YefM family antitoxin component YafN of YafNO toxin-antitoxin module
MAHSINEPIFITKNGEGDLVVMSIEEYRKIQKKLELFGKLAIAQSQYDSGEKGRPFQNVFKDLRKRIDEKTLD